MCGKALEAEPIPTSIGIMYMTHERDGSLVPYFNGLSLQQDLIKDLIFPVSRSPSDPLGPKMFDLNTAMIASMDIHGNWVGPC